MNKYVLFILTAIFMAAQVNATDDGPRRLRLRVPNDADTNQLKLNGRALQTSSMSMAATEIHLEDNTFSELIDTNTIGVEYAENLEGIVTEVLDNVKSMAAGVGSMDVDTNSLETLLFEHGEHWPEYNHDTKCLFLRKILKFIWKYHHHEKSGILGKKIEYLIEYKCNKLETTTTVGRFHFYVMLCNKCDMMYLK